MEYQKTSQDPSLSNQTLLKRMIGIQSVNKSQQRGRTPRQKKEMVPDVDESELIVSEHQNLKQKLLRESPDFQQNLLRDDSVSTERQMDDPNFSISETYQRSISCKVFCLLLFSALIQAPGFFSYYSLAPLLNEIKKIMEISNLQFCALFVVVEFAKLFIPLTFKHSSLKDPKFLILFTFTLIGSTFLFSTACEHSDYRLAIISRVLLGFSIEGIQASRHFIFEKNLTEKESKAQWIIGNIVINLTKSVALVFPPYYAPYLDPKLFVSHLTFYCFYLSLTLLALIPFCIILAKSVEPDDPLEHDDSEEEEQEQQQIIKTRTGSRVSFKLLKKLNFSFWAVCISDSIYKAIVKTFFIFGIYMFAQDFNITFLQASQYMVIPFLLHCVLSVLILPLVKKNKKLFCKKILITLVLLSTCFLFTALLIFFLTDLFFSKEEEFIKVQLPYVLVALFMISFSLSTRSVVLPSMIPQTLPSPAHTASALAMQQTMRTLAAGIFLIVFAWIKDNRGQFENTWVYLFSALVCAASLILIGFLPLSSSRQTLNLKKEQLDNLKKNPLNYIGKKKKVQYSNYEALRRSEKEIKFQAQQRLNNQKSIELKKISYQNTPVGSSESGQVVDKGSFSSRVPRGTKSHRDYQESPFKYLEPSVKQPSDDTKLKKIQSKEELQTPQKDQPLRHTKKTQKKSDRGREVREIREMSFNCQM